MIIKQIGDLHGHDELFCQTRAVGTEFQNPWDHSAISDDNDNDDDDADDDMITPVCTLD